MTNIVLGLLSEIDNVVDALAIKPLPMHFQPTFTHGVRYISSGLISTSTMHICMSSEDGVGAVI